MKPSPNRLILTNYPNTLDVPARFSDLDPLNHLNNVAIGNFYEEGRVNFNREAFASLRDRRRIRILMVNVSITYLREGKYPMYPLVTPARNVFSRSPCFSRNPTSANTSAGTPTNAFSPICMACSSMGNMPFLYLAVRRA